MNGWDHLAAEGEGALEEEELSAVPVLAHDR